MPLAIVAAIALAQRPHFYVFKNTVSPSGRWAIAHAGPGDKNLVFDTKRNRPVATLRGFSGFLHENHGGMYAAYSKDEKLLIADQTGKWSERAVALATTEGAQIDVLKRIERDAKRFTRPEYVFSITGARFRGTTLELAMGGEVPKLDDPPSMDFSLSYPVTVRHGIIRLGRPRFAKLTEKQLWGWPKQNPED